MPKYKRWDDEDQKAEQTESWSYQLKLVLFLQGQIAKREFYIDKDTYVMQPEPYCLSLEEAQSLWDEIDHFKYGGISGQQLQRWLEVEAGFAIPASDVHFLYESFKSFEYEHRITEKQWISALAGPQPEPAQEEPVVESGAEQEGPTEVQAPIANKTGTSLRKKKQPEAQAPVQEKEEPEIK